MGKLADQLGKIVALLPTVLPVLGRSLGGFLFEVFVEGIAESVAQIFKKLRQVVSELVESKVVGTWEFSVVLDRRHPFRCDGFAAGGKKRSKLVANAFLTLALFFWLLHL